jgi:hypothetical protein
MTRFRLAATAAISLVALLVATTGGEAARDAERAKTSCKQISDGMYDYGDFKTTAEEFQRDDDDRASAAAYVPLAGAKVIVKLTDRTPENGNNVLDAKDTDRTNKNGVAKNRVEFNNFGNYRATITTKSDGEVVDKDTIDFGISDRVTGKCGPPLGVGEA